MKPEIPELIADLVILVHCLPGTHLAIRRDQVSGELRIVSSAVPINYDGIVARVTGAADNLIEAVAQQLDSAIGGEYDGSILKARLKAKFAENQQKELKECFDVMLGDWDEILNEPSEEIGPLLEKARRYLVDGPYQRHMAERSKYRVKIWAEMARSVLAVK